MNKTKNKLKLLIYEALLLEAPQIPNMNDPALDPNADDALMGADPNPMGTDPTSSGGMSTTTPSTTMGAPGGDPNAMGMDPNAMGGDPNAMGMDPNAMGGDPNAMGGGMDMGMGGMGGGMDMGMGMGGDPNAMGMDPNQQQPQQNTSILKYNQQLNTVGNIKFQKKDPEPGMDFKHFNQYIKDNYFAKSQNGSSVFPIPTKGKETKNFIEKVATPHVLKTINRALTDDKKVVFLSPEKLSYSNGSYTKDIYGYMAHAINSEFKDKVSFDVWNSLDTDKFFSDKKFWSDLENRTSSDSHQIKAALYLFFKNSGKDVSVTSKLGGKSTAQVLKKWGVYENMMNNTEIKKLLYPEAYDQPQNQASMILKAYEYLKQLEFLKKLIKYEKLGYVAVAPTTKDIAWTLNDTIKNLDKLKKLKKQQQQQAPDMNQGSSPAQPQPPMQ